MCNACITVVLVVLVVLDLVGTVFVSTVFILCVLVHFLGMHVFDVIQPLLHHQRHPLLRWCWGDSGYNNRHRFMFALQSSCGKTRCIDIFHPLIHIFGCFFCSILFYFHFRFYSHFRLWLLLLLLHLSTLPGSFRLFANVKRLHLLRHVCVKHAHGQRGGLSLQQ